MTAEDFLVYDSSHGQAVEAVREGLPQLYVIPSFTWTKTDRESSARHLGGHTNRSALTLVVKAVDPVNRGAFVIPTQQEKVLRVFDLVGQKQADGLQRLLPSVYVVAQEQVVALWGEAPVFKEPQQIVVLAVDVACRGR